jgi:DNA-binding NtrC family response regulator
MPASVRIVSPDAAFAGSVARRLESWGLSVGIESGIEGITPSLVRDEGVDVVLLDVRQRDGSTLRWLAAMKETAPAAEVVLLNASGDVRFSIEAMRAGATAELPAPLDVEALRRVLTESLRHRNRPPPRARPSLLERFERAMAAATFAQAGEFDAARDLLGDEGGRRRGRGGKGRN